MINKIQGCLLGVAIGDALGMPVETMTAEEIAQAGGISGFISPIQKKIKDTEHLAAGMTTDDWQLTEVVGRSLVRCGRFDLWDQTLLHIEALEKSQFGWGRNTQTGVEELKKYIDSRGAQGRKPGEHRKTGKGSGNGVAMKIAPLACYHACSDRIWELDRECIELGGLTHSNYLPAIAAFALAQFIWCNLKNIAVKDGLYIVKHYVEIVDPGLKEIAKPFLERLEKLNKIDSLYQLREEIGSKVDVLESVIFAIGIFLRNPGDFKTGILEAVNSGGDTDSVASMVGALIGSRVGLKGIPEEWRNFSPGFKRAEELGEEIFNLK